MSTMEMRFALSKLRRRLTFWRVVAVLAVVGLLWTLLTRGGGLQSVAAGGEHIARIRIDGFITGGQRQLDLIESLRRNKSVKAVIVRINSPGGSTSGSEAIYRALRRVAETKPVVTVMDGVAASGGYIVALAGERMFASGNTITGSIGVIVQWPELHELLGKIGVRVQAVRSGPLKALPNGYEPTPEEARKVIEQLVRDSYDWFVQLVARRRGLDEATVRKLADGRIYSGRMALKAGLVDALGDEWAARKWLEKKHKIAFSTPVRTHQPRRSLLQQLGVPQTLLKGLGLSVLGAASGRWLEQWSGVDGLLSVWHPALMMGMKRQESE